MEEITSKLIREKFCEYNRLYFDDVLKLPAFKMNVWNNGIIGKFKNKRDENKKPIKPEIWISKYALFTEDTLREVILHEMIHYYIIFVEGYDGLFPHGWRFRRMCKKFYKKYGIKIHRNAKHIPYKK